MGVGGYQPVPGAYSGGDAGGYAVVGDGAADH
jgi:hypothetical protein